MYTLVVVEPRYLTGFVVLLGLAGLRVVQFPRESDSEMRRWGWAVVAVVVLAPTLWLALREGERTWGAGGSSANVSLQVAEELQGRGVHPGDLVGSIGSPFDCGWARLGRFRIGAEVRTPDVHAFWATDATQRAAVLAAFRKVGAKAVIARDVPVSEREWERVAGTDYAFFRILPVRADSVDDGG